MIHADLVNDPSDTALIDTPLVALHWHLNVLKPIKEPVVTLYMNRCSAGLYIWIQLCVCVFSVWKTQLHTITFTIITELNSMHVTRVTYHDPTPRQLCPDTAFLSDFSLRFQNLHLCNTEWNTREAWFNPTVEAQTPAYWSDHNHSSMF